MKKFKFRLERILQLKAHTEKDKQKNLALAYNKVLDQGKKLEGINRNRIESQQNQRNQLTGVINRALMSVYSRYYIQLKKNELTGNEILKAYKKEQEEKRQELVKATRAKKIYEKLKERKKEKYHKDQELTSQKEQDEQASQMIQYKKRLPK